MFFSHLLSSPEVVQPTVCHPQKLVKCMRNSEEEDVWSEWDWTDEEEEWIEDDDWDDD
jgi:hypothetical protein